MAKNLGDVTSKVVDLLQPFDEPDQRKVLNAAKVLLGHTSVEAASTEKHPARPSDPLRPQKVAPAREGTINVVAAKFGSDSCRKILMAAAIHLTLYQNREKWPREDWVKLASSARDWKSSYSSAVARDIHRLIKSGEINENAPHIYSLSSKLLSEASGKV